VEVYSRSEGRIKACNLALKRRGGKINVDYTTYGDCIIDLFVYDRFCFRKGF
jgi:hypothetical protein